MGLRVPAYASFEATSITVFVLDPGWVKPDMGGAYAPKNPEAVANEVYRMITAGIPTGKFWRDGETRDW